MNPETEQNITISEKPKMYLSWKAILLTSVSAVFLLTLSIIPAAFLITVFEYGWLVFSSGFNIFSAFLNSSYFFIPFVFWVVPVIILITILVVLQILGSFCGSPKGFVRTKYINTIFLSSPIVILLVPVIFPAMLCIGAFDGGCSAATLDGVYFLMDPNVLVVVLFGFLSLSTGVYLNHKFQKSESELEIKQS